MNCDTTSIASLALPSFESSNRLESSCKISSASSTSIFRGDVSRAHLKKVSGEIPIISAAFFDEILPSSHAALSCSNSFGRGLGGRPRRTPRFLAAIMLSILCCFWIAAYRVSASRIPTSTPLEKAIELDICFFIRFASRKFCV